MSELEELKAKLSKTNQLLDKLDERLAHGEISEARYKQLSEKYRAEAENLKNLVTEKELLHEVGLEGETREPVVEYQKEPEKIKYKEPEIKKEEKKGSITSAFFWMLFLSILLFWLPIIGSLIAGFVGGRKAGSVGRAILAGLLPTIIMVFLSTTVLSSILGGILGAILGGAVGIIIFLSSVILIIGAIIGAATAK